MFRSRRAFLRLAAAAIAILLAIPPLTFSAVGAVQPAISESASPSFLTFASGPAWTNLSLERNAHVRDAQLTVRGEPMLVSTPYRLNASTVGAGSANAWTGNMSFDIPDQPPEAYIATPFNATQIANASIPDGNLAKAPLASNFSYQLLIQQVPLGPAIELDLLWSGYALPPSMPIFTNGQVFAYNFTSLSWDNVAGYPYPMTGVQDVWFNTTHPANYIKPGTGSVAIMIVSESTQTEVFTDFFEITFVAATYPRPAVDVGDDGSIDWRFDAPGWGAMGRQTTFDDGFPSKLLTFPDGGANMSASFVLPEGVTPDVATVIARSVPDTHTRLRNGNTMTVGAGSGGSIVFDQLPPNSVGGSSFVKLVGVTTLNETTDANHASRTGTLLVGSDPNGFRSAAQTLNLSSTGPVANVSIYVYQVQGSPGPLNISIETLNATGIPTGSPLAATQVAQAALSGDSWLSFAMGGAILSQGAHLAIVVRAPLAPPDTITNYVTLGVSTNNNFTDGEALSYYNVTGLGESWSSPASSDFLFDFQQDLPTTSPEAAVVTLDSVSGTYSQSGSSSNISFNVPSTPLLNGSHTFSISNPGPLALRFNWSAAVDYAVIAEQLSISVAGTSGSPWNFTNLTSGAELDLTAAILDTNVSVPPGAPTPIRTLTLMVNSSSSGALEFSALDIRYVMNITTTDIAPAFDAALWATPPGPLRADVPIKVSSPGSSQLHILEAAITYDRAPVFSGFPSTISDEDVPLVVDLYTVFHDDYAPLNMGFHFDVISGASLGFVALRGYNLTITPTANASGDVIVNVTATDQAGLTNSSGPTTFTFAAVNDPPRLTLGAINVTWGAIQTVDLTAFIIDAETNGSSISIVSALGNASVTVVGRSLVFNFTAGAPDADLNITVTDGSASAVYPLHVHPRISNSPPVLLPIATLVIPANAAYWLDLAPYASDDEDAFGALTFSLASGNNGSSPLLWAIEKNATSTYLKLIPHAPAPLDLTVTLIVRDSDDNVDTATVGLQIRGPPNTPPRIVGVDPTISLGPDSVDVFLVTKVTDAEDGVAVPLTWEIENHDPQLFSATIDPGTLRLTVQALPGASGTGTFTLRVRDSGGAVDEMTISVSAANPQSGSSWSVVALGLFFAAVVTGTTIAIVRDRRKPKGLREAGKAWKVEADKPAAPELVAIQGEAEPEAVELPEVTEDSVEAKEDIGAYMRGETQSPTDTPPSDDQRFATLGLKSDLDGASTAAAAAAASRPALGAARMAELYLFSLPEGGLLYQAPAAGVPVLTQADENDMLQWAYNKVAKTEKHPDTVRILEWKDSKVVVARGASFYIVGRAKGEDFDALRRRAKTLVEEVDHNFPGTALEWQRTDMIETVADILKRLVKGA